MTIPTCVSAALILLILVGCGGGGTTPGPGPGPGPDPDPIDLTATTDDTRATTAEVPAEAGGTVTATGADGTSFTLTVPPNALEGDTAITLTPVTSVAGLPYAGGLSGGVTIAPADLEFLLPATLAITPPAALSPTDFHAFAIAPEEPSGAAARDTTQSAPLGGQLASMPSSGIIGGGGVIAGVSLYVPTSGLFAIGIGVGGLDHLPSSPYWYLIAREGDIIDSARAQGLLPSHATYAPILYLAITDYWTRVVRPALVEATTDSSKLDNARILYLRWLYAVNQISLAGIPDIDQRIEEGLLLLSGDYKWAIDELANGTCTPQSALELLLRARQMAVLNLFDRAPGTSRTEILLTVTSCAKFKLGIDEDLTSTSSGEFYRVRRLVEIPLRPNSNFFLTGEGTWTLQDGDPPGDPEGCCVMSFEETTPTIAEVKKVFPPIRPGQLASEWRVIIDVNKGNENFPQEIFRTDCSSCPEPPNPSVIDIPNAYWLLNWAALYLPNHYLADNAWLVDDQWVAGSGNPIVSRDIIREITYDPGDGEIEFGEVGLWVIEHTP